MIKLLVQSQRELFFFSVPASLPNRITTKSLTPKASLPRPPTPLYLYLYLNSPHHRPIRLEKCYLA